MIAKQQKNIPANLIEEREMLIHLIKKKKSDKPKVLIPLSSKNPFRTKVVPLYFISDKLYTNLKQSRFDLKDLH